MSYTILLERAVEKELRNLPAQMLRLIDKRLLALSDKSLPRGVVKLKGKEGEGWRIRIGDYRVLYEIDNKARTIKDYESQASA